jgi:hypothetical protein
LVSMSKVKHQLRACAMGSVYIDPLNPLCIGK